MGFASGSVVKNLPAKAGNTGDASSVLRSGRSSGERDGYPTPVFLPGESHGQRSLEGYGPWGRKEIDVTEKT